MSKEGSMSGEVKLRYVQHQNRNYSVRVRKYEDDVSTITILMENVFEELTTRLQMHEQQAELLHKALGEFLGKDK